MLTIGLLWWTPTPWHSPLITLMRLREPSSTSPATTTPSFSSGWIRIVQIGTLPFQAVVSAQSWDRFNLTISRATGTPTPSRLEAGFLAADQGKTSSAAKPDTPGVMRPGQKMFTSTTSSNTDPTNDCFPPILPELGPV